MEMRVPQRTITPPLMKRTNVYDGVRCEIEHAQPSRGKVLARSLARDSVQKYFLYIPSKGAAFAHTFIAVHGITRNAAEQADFFSSFAERYGVVLIAPLFPEDRFRDYQRLGREGKGKRADFALDAIVAEVGSLFGARTSKLYLFGFSGGGQFVHRYAMAYPERVARVALAAAGWYTFPDPTMDFPLGIKRTSGLPDISFNLARFLSVPTCVLVGENDVLRDPVLKKSRRIDRQQGVTRLERGKKVDQGYGCCCQGISLRYTFHLQGAAQV